MKIEKDKITITDKNDNLVETKEGITCGCENPKLKMVCHIDGVDFYGYTYQCSCGNVIEAHYQRNKEDMMF